MNKPMKVAATLRGGPRDGQNITLLAVDKHGFPVKRVLVDDKGSKYTFDRELSAPIQMLHVSEAEARITGYDFVVVSTLIYTYDSKENNA